MKLKFLLTGILFAAIIVNSCKKGDNPNTQIDGCPTSTLIDTAYLNDAKEIVYQRILAGDAVADAGQPNFNQQELGRVLSAIQSVYALHTATTDSIFNMYKIHAFKLYLLNSIILQVNFNAPEIQNLIKNGTTGNAGFDGSLTKYGFIYESTFPPTATLPFFVIKSTTWYNTQPLVAQFKTFSFVQGAEADGLGGDGDNITYQINGNVRTLDFSYAFGDCPAGCLSRTTWEFSIDANCNATFVKKTL